MACTSMTLVGGKCRSEVVDRETLRLPGLRGQGRSGEVPGDASAQRQPLSVSPASASRPPRDAPGRPAEAPASKRCNTLPILLSTKANMAKNRGYQGFATMEQLTVNQVDRPPYRRQPPPLHRAAPPTVRARIIVMGDLDRANICRFGRLENFQIWSGSEGVDRCPAAPRTR